MLMESSAAATRAGDGKWRASGPVWAHPGHAQARPVRDEMPGGGRRRQVAVHRVPALLGLRIRQQRVEAIHDEKQDAAEDGGMLAPVIHCGQPMFGGEGNDALMLRAQSGLATTKRASACAAPIALKARS